MSDTSSQQNATHPPRPEAVAGQVASPQPAEEAPLPPAPQSPVVEPQPVTDPALDLSLSAVYRGRPFSEIEWNWPAVIRTAMALCDYMLANPARQDSPLLPNRISLDAEGQLQIGQATVSESVPFTAPEIFESAANSSDDKKKKAKKTEIKIVPETAAVFHIGTITYYLLAGHPPIGNFVDIDDAPGTPEALRAILLRALDVDAKKRTSSLDELRRQLYFVLDPPAWFEKTVPSLPLDDELKTKVIDTLNGAQRSWYQLRDRIPYQQLGKARRRYDEALAHPRWGVAMRLAGVLLIALIYLVLLTDVI